MGIRIARLLEVTRMMRPNRDRQMVGHLDGKLEDGGNLRRKLLDLLLGWVLVKGGVDANGAEGLAVFRQAGLLELFVAHSAPPAVSRRRIDPADPARIFPRGGPDPDTASPQLC